MIEHPSPNHGPRSLGARVDMVVIHYTGMETAEAALARMCDAQAKVSAHYMIGEDGTVWRLVAEADRAWHAGESRWAGHRNINDISIGIELVNPGHEFGYRPFTPAQMAALIGLGREIVARHPIPPARVLGHSDVAPQRKQDPGELFDWAALAEAGLGLWPVETHGRLWPADPPGDNAKSGGKAAPEPGTSDLAIAAAQRHLAEFGYDVAVTGTLDAAGQKVVSAFQRHFRPGRIDGAIDTETAWRIEALCRLARG
ncbi:MAG: N-acetylmuramoyl-L-alanine amidase [Alphaproteobacteria bacterium]